MTYWILIVLVIGGDWRPAITTEQFYREDNCRAAAKDLSEWRVGTGAAAAWVFARCYPK